MTDINAALTAVSNELTNAALTAISNELTNLLKESTTSVDMTFEQFVAYCDQQLVLAKADPKPAARINALLDTVKLTKMYTWEDGATMSVPVFSQGESADAEKLNASFSIPGPQAASAGVAFEAASGPTGPASNTAAPAGRHMPPTFPQSEPMGSPEGFMAKAKELLGKAAPGDVLAQELAALLAEQPAIVVEPDAPANDHGWPHDLATPEFMNDKPVIPVEDDFGADPK